MLIFEHYAFTGEVNYQEVILQQAGKIFVYAPSGQLSGQYVTDLLVKDAKEFGLFDPEVEKESSEEGAEVIVAKDPEELMQFSWFYAFVQTALVNAASRMADDYQVAQEQAGYQEKYDLPENIWHLIEYCPNGFTNETVILYAVKEQHEAFLAWKEKLAAKDIKNYFWATSWQPLNELVPWLKENEEKNKLDLYGDYATFPQPWYAEKVQIS